MIGLVSTEIVKGQGEKSDMFLVHTGNFLVSMRNVCFIFLYCPFMGSVGFSYLDEKMTFYGCVLTLYKFVALCPPSSISECCVALLI